MRPDDGPGTALGGFTGAQWLAALGALLFAAAGVSLLATQWEAMSNVAKLITMLGATFVMGGMASAARSIAPATARAMLLLTGVLTALDAGAAVLVVGGGWPEATLACGVSGLILAYLARLLVGGPSSDVLQVIAGATLAAGAGAVFGVPAPLIMAGLACVAVLVPSWRRIADGWGTLAALPAVIVSSNGERFYGSGTLEDIGLLGHHIGWSAPVAGAVIALVFIYRSTLTKDARYLVAAFVAAALGTLASWSHYEPSSTVLALIAGLVFLVVQAVAMAFEKDDDYGPLLARLADVSRLWAAAFTAGMAMVGMGYWSISEVDQYLAAAALLTAMGWAISWYRTLSFADAIAFASMVCVALLFAGAPMYSVGAVTVAAGLGWLAMGIWQRRSTGVAYGSLLTTAGSWIIMGDLQLEILELYVLPLALAIIAGGEAVAMGMTADGEPVQGEREPVSSWGYWMPALGLLSASALIGHVDGSSAAHLNYLALSGVVAGIWGAAKRESAPLLLGTIMAVAGTAYQVLDYTVGVAGWGWMAIGGLSLLCVAVVMEHVSVREHDHPPRIVRSLTRSFR